MNNDSVFPEILIGTQEPRVYIRNEVNKDLNAMDRELEKGCNVKGVLDEIRIETIKKSRRMIKCMKGYEGGLHLVDLVN